LTRLLNATKFPWLLSNIVDENTEKQPEKFLKYWITERCGVKIGVIGLVEQYVNPLQVCGRLMSRDWIATIPSWPESFKYRSMVDTAMELSKELRDPKGEHKVDMIIALTHCRVPNVSLASWKNECSGGLMVRISLWQTHLALWPTRRT
jgi:2',3'-cyclic-nucleotide 2'-phosphodiesterase (5'-nucleotidase family)